jgi:hypothetical protein
MKIKDINKPIPKTKGPFQNLETIPLLGGEGSC